MTASMKIKILNAVLDYANMNISYDESKELLASRIRAEQYHLSKFLKNQSDGKSFFKTTKIFYSTSKPVHKRQKMLKNIFNFIEIWRGKKRYICI